MQHRDEVILHKVISEINIAHDMLGMTTQEEFINDIAAHKYQTLRYGRCI